MRGRKRAHAIEDAAGVHAHRPVPVLVAGTGQAANDRDTRVIDQYVDLAEYLNGLGGRLFHRGPIGDIHIDGMHAIGGTLQQLHGLIQVGAGAVGDDHLHAGVREGAGNP